nr:uncharacterized protein LOC107281111 isoform X2 [Oryza sativa Japonica Group]
MLWWFVTRIQIYTNTCVNAVNNGISPRYSFDSIYLSYDGVIWRKTPKDCGLCCETPEDRVFARGHCKKCGAEARRRPQRGGGGGASPGFTADSDDARRHPGAWLPLSLSLLFFSPSSSSQRSRGATTVGRRRRRIARARRVQHRQALALRVEGRRRCHCRWPWRVRAGGRQYTDLDWQGSGAAWTLLAGHDAARSSTQHARHGHSPACRCPLQPNSVRLALQWRRWWWPPPLFLRLHGQLPPVEVTEWGTSMTARREKIGTLSLLLRLLVVLQPWNNLLF